MTAEQVAMIIGLVIVALPILLIILFVKFRKERRTRREFEKRFSGVIDAEAQRTRIRAEADSIQREIENLRSDYREKRAVYDRLAGEVAIFDEKLAFAELGVYEPHFEFQDSEAYKRRIQKVRDLQKIVVTQKAAVVGLTEWTVDGSKTKGRQMTDRQIRLTLRAFNGECDAAISNVRWNNANAMEKRILHAADQINKMNASSNVLVTNEYIKMKLEELYLTHEYRETQKREREERADAARLEREEKRLQRDAQMAEEEEARYERLLAKARAQAARVEGAKLEAFQAQIEMLERDLAEAHAKAERARSMAEQTRSGYVYVISNIGSFGEDIVKIRLTRRLDPEDHIWELGDASVPFVFDIHAMIYSDDAPALERALHSEFDSVRVNATNYRKEFFRASLDQIEDAVRRIAPEAGFFRDREAQEYRETLSKRRDTAKLQGAEETYALPLAI